MIMINKNTKVFRVRADGVFDAIHAGDHHALLSGLVSAAANGPAGVETVLLAQYSLTPVAEHLQTKIDLPVPNEPRRAAQTLRDLIIGQGG